MEYPHENNTGSKSLRKKLLQMRLGGEF